MDLPTLQRMHPQWNLVDFLEAPNGGLWALGSDGGVFSLDSSGGTAGTVAPFYGAYTTIAPAARNDPNRTFQRIEINPAGTGYQLVSTNQEIYGKGNEFGPPPPPNPLTAPPAVNTTNTQQATGTAPATGQSLSASAAIHAVFDPLGLGSLADTALNYLNSTPGATADYVTKVWLPDQQQYKQMFPEVGQAQAAVASGKNIQIPTPADIVSYRQTAQTMVNQGLIPPELATNDKVGQLILGGVSPTEFENRVTTGYNMLNNADPATRDALLSYEGVDASHLVAHLIDPTFNQEQFNNAITRAQIGGAATRSGFGGLSAGEAQNLVGAGVTAGQAQSGLSTLAQENPLFQNLAGETGTISRQEQLGTLTGNAADIAEIEQRRQARQAAFQGGGGGAGFGSGGGGSLGTQGG